MTRRKSGNYPIASKPRSTLKMVAEHVGLTPSRSIPEQTKHRIVAPARELNYKPHFWARRVTPAADAGYVPEIAIEPQ